MTVRGTLGPARRSLGSRCVDWSSRDRRADRAGAPAADAATRPALLDAPTRRRGAHRMGQRGGDRLTLVRTPAGWHDAAGIRGPPTSSTSCSTRSARCTRMPCVRTSRSTSPSTAWRPPRSACACSTARRRELLAIEIGDESGLDRAATPDAPGAPEVLLVGALLRWELDKLRRLATRADSLDNHCRSARTRYAAPSIEEVP